MQIIFASAKIEKPWREPSTTTTAVPRLHGTDLRSFEVQKRLRGRAVGSAGEGHSPRGSGHPPYTKGNLGLLAVSPRFAAHPRGSGCCDEWGWYLPPPERLYPV